MSKNPATQTASAESLRQLSEALRTLEGRIDPNELARRVVRAALAQPGITGARMWRVEEGQSRVWEQAGELPASDSASTLPSAAARGLEHQGLQGTKSPASPAEDMLIWATVLGSDDFRMRVLEARAARPIERITRNRLELLARFAAVALALEHCRSYQALEFHPRPR
jgi:hypothetical protein